MGAGPYRLEVWDVAGTSLEAVLRWGADVISANETQELNGRHTLNVTMRRDSDKWAYLSGRKVIVRQSLSDPDDYMVFRLVNPKEGTSQDGTTTGTLTAVHWAIEDLGALIWKKKAPYIQVNSKALIDTILTGSGWSAGATWPTTNIDFEVDFDSILEILRKMVNQLGMDLDLNAAWKTVNAVDLGSSKDIHLRIGKDILADEKSADYTTVVTRVVPVGGGEPVLTIARSQLVVLGVAVNQISVDPYCIPSDDSHIGDFIYFDTGAAAGNAYAITDSATGATFHTISTAVDLAAAGVLAGDKVRITDSAGNGLTYIDDASAQDDYGALEGRYDADYPPVENLILNGAMKCDGANSCPSWTRTDAGTVTITRNTTADYIKFGMHSLRVETTAADQGIYQSVTLDTTKQYSLSVWVYVVSGACRLEVQDGAGPTRWWPPEDRVLNTSTTGWIQLLLEGIVPENAACDVRIVQDGASNADFYVDSVLFTEGGASPVEFTEDRTATRLRREAYAWQRERCDPEVTYKVDAKALALIAPRAWPYEGWVLGDTLRLTDERIGVDVDVRVKQISWDVGECAVQSIVFDNVRQGTGSRVSDLYARDRARRRRLKDTLAPSQAEEATRGDTQRWTSRDETGRTITREYLMDEHPRLVTVLTAVKNGDTVLAANHVVPVGRKLVWFFNPFTTWNSANAAIKYYSTAGGPRVDFNFAELYDKDYAAKHQMYRIGLASSGTIYYVTIPAGTYGAVFTLSSPIWKKDALDSIMGGIIGYYQGAIMVVEVPA